jgi:DnaJ like chaperone protein
MWHGKLIGAILGLLLSRYSPWGAFIGILIGHFFDLQVTRGRGSQSDARTIQTEFFRTTFQTMGHVAKADGRVSEDEIRAARAVMAQLRLGDADVRMAIGLFSEGKARDFPLQETLNRLGRVLGNRPDLRRMFIQIQLQAALWSGSLNAAARAVLLRACAQLGVSEFEFAQLEALLRMQRAGTYGPGRGYGPGPERPRPQAEMVQDAYSVLGIQSSASNAEVTKAYRRLMSQNHPDKMAANGLPDSMKGVAEEKTRQIRAAYEAIRETRGMR